MGDVVLFEGGGVAAGMAGAHEQVGTAVIEVGRGMAGVDMVDGGGVLIGFRIFVGGAANEFGDEGTVRIDPEHGRRAAGDDRADGGGFGIRPGGGEESQMCSGRIAEQRDAVRINGIGLGQRVRKGDGGPDILKLGGMAVFRGEAVIDVEGGVTGGAQPFAEFDHVASVAVGPSASVNHNDQRLFRLVRILYAGHAVGGQVQIAGLPVLTVFHVRDVTNDDRGWTSGRASRE